MAPAPASKRDYKRLIVCCDGTWQASDRPEQKGINVASNVTKMCRALAHADARDGREVQQIVYYQSGVGTDMLTKFSRDYAGAF